MARTVLVTGGAGFIGSHVVDRLLAYGDQVVCVDDFNDYYSPEQKRQNCELHHAHERYRLYEEDISDAAAMHRVFQRHRPDVVIHLAARAGVRASFEHPSLYERTNVQGTICLLEAARKARVTCFVNASSSSVYGDSVDGVAQEDTGQLTPASPYGATKLAAEAMCRVYAHQYGLNVLSLRFFTVYGPRQRPDMAISRFARRLLQGHALPVYGDGTAERDFTYVSDTVRGILLATRASRGGHEVLNLGCGSPVTINELIGKLARQLDVTPILSYLPKQPGDVRRTCSDNTKARSVLGYVPRVALTEGIHRYLCSLPDLDLTMREAETRFISEAPFRSVG